MLADSPIVSEYDETDEDETQSPQRHTKPSQTTNVTHDPEFEDDEDIGGWGASKTDYYNADTIETEADALEEEAEARRLQQKQLEGLTEEDFGLNDVRWTEEGKRISDGDDEHGRESVFQEVLPDLEITDTMSSEERYKIMRMRYPEFEPLAQEFISLQTEHEDLKVAAEAASATQIRQQAMLNDDELLKVPVAVVKNGALSSYLGALCMYFALFTSRAGDSNGRITAMAPVELRNHKIMVTLVQCRELWAKVKDIPNPEPSDLLLNGGADSSYRDTAMETEPRSKKLSSLVNADDATQPKRGPKKPRRSKAKKPALAAQVEEQASRLERIQKSEQDLQSLSASIVRSGTVIPKKVILRPDSPLSTSSFGEQTALNQHEAFEKAKRKKSLRFYTSQITQKTNKREIAGRHAGGDDDIPHRERLRDRQARLNAEAENRGKKNKLGVDDNNALGGDSGDEDRRATAEIREIDEEDDYYDLISKRVAQKKADKVALVAVRKTPGALAEIDNEEVGADGKRAITYAIAKNKGLAPRRKKDVRNPRVKKRKKFEEKKKKLGSTKAVYKGGEGRGGYGGELTGIKKSLVRGIKL